MTEIALGICFYFAARCAAFLLRIIFGRLGLGERGFQLFKYQIELIRIELFGLFAEAGPS